MGSAVEECGEFVERRLTHYAPHTAIRTEGQLVVAFGDAIGRTGFLGIEEDF
jgi:hypothetical protein